MAVASSRRDHAEPPSGPGVRRRLQRFAIVLGPGVAALAMFAWRSGTPALWTDEGSTVRDAWRALPSLLEYLAERDAVLGAYYLFMHLWLRLGDAEWWVRLPSVLAMAGAVTLTADLARRWWGPRSALAAGAVLVLAPAMTRYAQEARPYAIAVFLAALSTWLLVRALADPAHRRGWYVGYAAALAALGLTHLLSLAVLVPQLVYLAWPLIGPARRKRAWPAARRWLVAALVGLVPSLALAAVAFNQRAQISWIPSPDLAAIRSGYVDLVGTTALFVLCLGIALLGVRAERAWVTAAVWFGVPPMLLAAAGVVTPLFHPRYVLISALGLALLVGASVRRVGGTSLLAVAALAAVLAAPSQRDIRAVNGHGPDTRAMAKAVREDCHPGDAVRYTEATLTTVDTYLRRDHGGAEGAGGACRPRIYTDRLPEGTRRIWVFHEPWDSEPASAVAPGFVKVRDVPVSEHELSLWERSGRG